MGVNYVVHSLRSSYLNEGYDTVYENNVVEISQFWSHWWPGTMRTRCQLLQIQIRLPDMRLIQTIVKFNRAILLGFDYVYILLEIPCFCADTPTYVMFLVLSVVVSPRAYRVEDCE